LVTLLGVRGPKRGGWDEGVTSYSRWQRVTHRELKPKELKRQP